MNTTTSTTSITTSEVAQTKFAWLEFPPTTTTTITTTNMACRLGIPKKRRSGDDRASRMTTREKRVSVRKRNLACYHHPTKEDCILMQKKGSPLPTSDKNNSLRKNKELWQEHHSCCSRRREIVLGSNNTSRRRRTLPLPQFKTTSGLFFLLFLLLAATPTVAHPGNRNPNNKEADATTTTKNNKATLTIFDFTSWSYRAEIAADFGNPMLLLVPSGEFQQRHHATLMVPPTNYSTLCEMPPILLQAMAESDAAKKATLEEEEANHESQSTSSSSSSSFPQLSTNATQSDLEDSLATIMNTSTATTTTATTTSLPWHFPGPVGLLVSLGHDKNENQKTSCSVAQKVKVALQIHLYISTDVKYVVFYNQDFYNPDVIAPLSSLESTTTTTTSNPNNNTNESGSVPASQQPLQPTIEWTDQEKALLENTSAMVFVSVSTGTGAAILGRMKRLAKGTGTTTPEFQNPASGNSSSFGGYRQWHLPMVLERVDDTTGRPGFGPSITNNNLNDGGGGGSYDSSYSFYWFRFILFTLLIVSPCLRAGYLWWAGGGRIRLRRNPDTGRIVGLQYTPPMHNWFSIVYLNFNNNNQDSQDQAPVHDRLTEEQVMALPEITYKLPLAAGNDEDAAMDVDPTSEDGGRLVETPLTSEGANSTTMADSTTISDQPKESQVLSLCKDEPVQLDLANLNSTSQITNPDPPSLIADVVPSSESISSEEGIDEEQPPEISRASSTSSSSSQHFRSVYNKTTTCTTCSICIDEFVDGERLRLLPRCGHAFHTECILPWLSERQGCCPLCKTAVLASPVDSEEVEEETDAASSSNHGGSGGEDGADVMVTTVDGPEDTART